jgi:hypothetical protein
MTLLRGNFKNLITTLNQVQLNAGKVNTTDEVPKVGIESQSKAPELRKQKATNVISFDTSLYRPKP